MDTTFSFLGLTVHAYGLCASLAAMCMLAGMRIAGRDRLPKGAAAVFGTLGIPLGVLGARLLYCLCNLTTFTQTYENPWLMLRFFDGGFSLPGLIAGLCLAAALTARLLHMRVSDVLDAACVPAGLALAVLRFGEQFTDLGIGKAVQEGFATAHFPWLFAASRMGVAVEYRLNVWAYETAAGLILFVLTLLARRALQRRSGDTALFFALLFGASQILLESMRDDGHMLLIFLRVGQLGAAVLPLVACAVLCRRAGALRRWLTWAVVALCVLAVVLLEFSLDGRLTFGTPSLARDYGIMAAACAALFAVPGSLLLLPKSRKDGNA